LAISLVRLLPPHVVICTLAAHALFACDGDGLLEPRSVLFTQSPAAADGGAEQATRDGDDGDRDEGAKAADSSKSRRSSARDDDAGTLRSDGSGCDVDDECASDHCGNGLCCSSGECCLDTADCSVGSGVAIICEYPTTCHGLRGPIVCRDYRCSVDAGDPDDSACDERVVADDCGPFASITCSGEVEQRTPHCADTCDTDSECDREAHCDSTCIPDVPKGGACDENSDCISGQCNGGRCCVDGNCARDFAASPAEGLLRCRDTLASDACSQCGCDRCTESMLGCYDSGNEARDSLCSTVLECAFRESCFSACTEGEDCFREGCWCGNDCTDPSGSCTRPIEAAAGGANSAMTLAERAGSSSYALYFAEQYGTCLNQNCSAECDLVP
jgi:hypothetical protein